MLTREWKKRAKRSVLALIAEGGTGKSFLVSRWLAELKDKKPAPYAGAERIFTWSFYSQGSKGQITSSEGFFSDLLRSFGEKSEDYDSLSRADKALELVSKETMILVLDGVEPLQNLPGHTDAGRFHDRTMGDFINRLAGQPWPSLVIVTSRQRLVELAAGEGEAILHVDVESLNPKDGVKLLTSLGVTGPDEEMCRAVEDMAGHAFGLVLLGHYLVDVVGGPDITKHDHVKLLKAHVKGAEKAKAMLQAYADWFGAESAETAMLLRRLEELKLITRPDAETVDGHPLVREHFGAALEKSSPDVWKQAHSRLFDYFFTIPDKDQPDGEASLLPLYQSLHHGVAAGRAQEALFDIYYQRIDRNGRGYGTHQLSLFSTELAVFAAFFPGGWQTPVQEVSREAQGYLLNLAGFGLRALGRLKEAQTPFERNIALNIELEDYLHAAADSDNLRELLFERGELQATLKRSNDTVELIDRATEKHEQSAYRAQTAHVLAILGKVE